MTRKIESPRNVPVTEFLLARDERGFRKYRKKIRRDPEKREILLALALNKIEKADRDNFISLGFRRRRVIFSAP